MVPGTILVLDGGVNSHGLIVRALQDAGVQVIHENRLRKGTVGKVEGVDFINTKLVEPPKHQPRDWYRQFEKRSRR